MGEKLRARKIGMINKYKEIKDRFVESQFVESECLPTNTPISTPINFVHFGSEVILTQGEDGFWGPVYGQPKVTADWEREMIKETQQKVGVSIERLVLSGYVLNESHKNSHAPSKTVSPVCYSYCNDIDLGRAPKGAKIRELFSHSNVQEHLAAIKDGGQMLKTYLYIHDQIKKDLRMEFSFLPDEMPEDIIITSAMVFCADNEKRICVVKDGGEDFYSLPGGGRKLTESPLSCAKRELFEEAQIVGKDFKIFGTILVSFFLKDVLVSRMQQARYICNIDFMEEFIPHKDGFETNERIFVPADQLLTLVKQFKNKDGAQIIDHLKSRLGD